MDKPIVPTPVAVYDAAKLLDAVKRRVMVRHDAELARFLEVGRPLLSKIRSAQCMPSAGLMIRMHEACGMEIAEMRRIVGDRREKFRV